MPTKKTNPDVDITLLPSDIKKLETRVKPDVDITLLPFEEESFFSKAWGKTKEIGSNITDLAEFGAKSIVEDLSDVELGDIGEELQKAPGPEEVAAGIQEQMFPSKKSVEPKYPSLITADFEPKTGPKETPEPKEVVESDLPDLTPGRAVGVFVAGGQDVARNVQMARGAKDIGIGLKGQRSRKERKKMIDSLRRATEKGFVAEKSNVEYSDIETGKKKIKTALETPWMQPDPKYLKSSGFLEDVIRIGPQILAQMGAGFLIGPAGSGALMGVQIIGSSYENYLRQGVEPERAWNAAVANALMQAPLEGLGMAPGLKFIKGRTGILSKLKKIAASKKLQLGAAAGAEWFTEFVQAWPEEITNIFATNPDKNALQAFDMALDNWQEVIKRGAKEGLTVMPWTLVGMGAGRVANRRIQNQNKKIREALKTLQEKADEFASTKAKQQQLDLNAEESEAEGVAKASASWPNPEFARRNLPLLKERVAELNGTLRDSNVLANSDIYDGKFPIPKQGGLLAARNTQRYKMDPEYQDWVEGRLNEVKKNLSGAQDTKNILSRALAEDGGLDFDTSFQIDQNKVNAGYGVDVARAWNMEAKHKYPGADYLGNISVREAIQNSLDAVLEAKEQGQIKVGNIDIEVGEAFDTETEQLIDSYAHDFRVTDNGIGMSDTDIRDKFLALHGTGKDKEGRFGGFGIAKAVILGPSDTATWVLETRDNRHTSEAAQNAEQVQTLDRARQGTRIIVRNAKTVINEQAKMYAETTIPPKGINITFNGDKVKNPFARKKGKKQTFPESDNTTVTTTYYPRPPENYNQKLIIRLVDKKTRAKLTQGIRRVFDSGFKGTIIADIETTETPGTGKYPLTDSRMDFSWGHDKPIQEIISKYSTDKLTAQRVDVESKSYKIADRPEWKKTLEKIDNNDVGYWTVVDEVEEIFDETGEYFQEEREKRHEEAAKEAGRETQAALEKLESLLDRGEKLAKRGNQPYTALKDMNVEIDVGFKGYKGGSMFHAKHLLAYEAVARLYSNAAGAPVNIFEPMLSKEVDGGRVLSSYDPALGKLSLNYLGINKASLKNPLTYAMYLKGLIDHELTHYYQGEHNEDYSSARERTHRNTAELFPYTMRIAEAVMGVQSEKAAQPVQQEVAEPTEDKSGVRFNPNDFFEPEQLELFNKQGVSNAERELYYPETKGAGGQLRLFGRSVERGLGRRDRVPEPERVGRSPELTDTQANAQIEPTAPRSEVNDEKIVNDIIFKVKDFDVWAIFRAKNKPNYYVYIPELESWKDDLELIKIFKSIAVENNLPKKNWITRTSVYKANDIELWNAEESTIDIEPQTNSEKTAYNIEKTANAAKASQDINNIKPTKEVPYQHKHKEIEDYLNDNQDINDPGKWEKAKALFRHITKSWTRDFEHLPRGDQFSAAGFILRKLAKKKSFSSGKAVEKLDDLTKALSPEETKQFSSLVVLRDMYETWKTNGVTPINNRTGKKLDPQKIHDAIINLSRHTKGTIVEKTLKLRTELWNSVRQDYIDAMDSIGITNAAQKFTRNDYFRHIVQDYIRHKGLFGITHTGINTGKVTGTGKELKAPTGRSYLKKRTGYTGPYLTDYFTSESEVLAQIYYDIEIANALAQIREIYDISDQLKDQAAEMTKEIRKDNPDAAPVDWRTLINEETHASFQPMRGNRFFFADTVPAKIAEQLHNQLIKQYNLTEQELGRVLAVGPKRLQMIIPKELAAQLNSMMPEQDLRAVSLHHKWLVRKWKAWQLHSPRRFIKYNLRNLSGDAEALFVGNPKAFLQAPRAIKELYNYFRGGEPSAELQLWLDRGGMQTLLQAQELGEINKIKRFMDRQGKKSTTKEKFFKVFKGYWKLTRQSTDFREGILRYAAFLNYRNQVFKNNGKPKNFGASMPEEVMVLKNWDDRAFMLANDLLGAYDRVSVSGQWVRDHLLPFWSFQEVNIKRYKQLMANAINDGRTAEAVGRKMVAKALSPSMYWRIGKFVITATALRSFLEAYNRLMFGDLEDKLPKEVQKRAHILLGTDDNGNPIYFTRLGILGDFLEWFGLDASVYHIRKWVNGEMNMKEVAESMIEQPVNKLLQGALPITRNIIEFTAGISLYPNVLEPKLVRDRVENLLKSYGLEHEYREFFNKPRMNYNDTLFSFFAYKMDMGQAAYGNFWNIKKRFLKRLGRLGRGAYHTPQGNALYNAALSWRYGDTETYAKYLQEYIMLSLKSGREPNQQAIDDLMERFDPLSGLTQKEKGLLLASLNANERKTFMLALIFYTELKAGIQFGKAQE